MCLILFAYSAGPKPDLLVLANRDEFLDRPTRQAGFWDDAPDVLGGRDLQSGGTWLAVSTRGRFAAVTNVREPGRVMDTAPSRGGLVSGFMTGSMSAREWSGHVHSVGAQYNGFNLLLFDGTELLYVSNRIDDGPVVVPSGIHGLSNAALDTPWPKVVTGRNALEALCAAGEPSLHDCLDILEDETRAADATLPSTGVPLELERVLSARLIVSPEYGTRTSTVVRMSPDDAILFMEKTHHPESIRPRAVTFELIAS